VQHFICGCVCGCDVVGGVCCPLPEAEREAGAVSVFLSLHGHAHQGRVTAKEVNVP